MRFLIVTLALAAATSAAAAPANPCTAQWTPVAHPQGTAWSWNANPQLQIVQKPGTGGLHVFYSGFSIGPVTSPQFGGGVMPPLLAWPPTSGPQVLSLCTLTLRVQGSNENGCDDLGFDDAVVTVTPVVSAQNTLQVTLRAYGTVYWSIPQQGTIQVTETSGVTTIAAAPFGAGAGDVVFNDAQHFWQWGTSNGTYFFDVESALPWLQIQTHNNGGFLEVDMDHSCEAQFAPLELPVTSMTLWINTLVGPPDPHDPHDGWPDDCSTMICTSRDTDDRDVGRDWRADRVGP